MYDGLNKCIFDPFVSINAHIQVTFGFCMMSRTVMYNVNTEARAQSQNSWVPEPCFYLMNSLTFKQSENNGKDVSNSLRLHLEIFSA